MTTPLHIRIALHYYVRSDIPYAENEPAHRHSVATREYTQHLVEAGLLERIDGLAEYRATKALGVYVDALCGVPWPVLRWVIPTAFDPSAPQS